MAEKLLIADALDERDFLRVKIHKAIQNCSFVTVKRKKDEKTSSGTAPEDYIKRAESDYQSISDMIVRLKKINSAIIVSNATTNVTLKSGLTMTRAEAIARRKEIKSNNSDDLEYEFIQAMQRMITSAQKDYSILTKKADMIAETYNGNISSKDKDLNIKQIEAAKVLTAEEYPEIIDPLDLEKKYTERTNQYTTLAKELDTAIKVSNATTYIEI